MHLPAVLSEAFGLSTSDVRRLVTQGGVRVEDRVVDALDLPRAELVGSLVQVGKRRFVRLTD